MSEEEKKAIKKIKNMFPESEELKLLLNLINKQQKEIEDLKAITQNYNAIGGETFGDDRIIVCSMKYFDDGYFKKNYIFKDKIREKIKAFQDVKKEIIKNENKLSRASITYDIVRNDYCEKMLQELLEDGDHIPRID